MIDSKAWACVVAVDQDEATNTPRDHPDAAWLARGQLALLRAPGLE